MTCFIWVVFVHVNLFQGIPEIAFIAEKELKPQINKQTNKWLCVVLSDEDYENMW